MERKAFILKARGCSQSSFDVAQRTIETRNSTLNNIIIIINDRIQNFGKHDILFLHKLSAK